MKKLILAVTLSFALAAGTVAVMLVHPQPASANAETALEKAQREAAESKSRADKAVNDNTRNAAEKAQRDRDHEATERNKGTDPDRDRR